MKSLKELIVGAARMAPIAEVRRLTPADRVFYALMLAVILFVLFFVEVRLGA